jgi:hypothetical protein
MRVFMDGLGFLWGNNPPLSPIRSATARLRRRLTQRLAYFLDAATFLASASALLAARCAQSFPS